MCEAVPTPIDLSAPPDAAPLCEAPDCGRALAPDQVRKGAKACSARCRAAAHRAARKTRRLAEIDAAVSALLELRAEIAKG
jgi:hypothetical protein